MHIRLILLSQCLSVLALLPVLCLSQLRSAGADEIVPTYPLSDPDVAFLPPSPTDEVGVSTTQQEIQALLSRIQALETADEIRSKKEAEKKVSDGKKPSVKFSQELQVDLYTFNQDESSKQAYGDINNGTAFRRARVALYGDWGPSIYRIEMDFAQPGRPTFLDVYGGFQDLPNLGRVRVGHFFEPFLLDRMTSNRYQIFMERAFVDQAFAPGRSTGIGANNTYLNEQGTWAAGVYRKDDGPFGDDVDDSADESLTGRVTYLPYYDERTNGSRLFHLGGAYSVRSAHQGEVHFRAQPEARLGAAIPNVPFFVNTGKIPASSYQLMEVEFALVNGPFSVQSEYVASIVDSDNLGTLSFHGVYVTTSYYLTGEHRNYNRKTGTFARTRPKRDFLRYAGQPADKCVVFGPGAWEIAARVSFLDLNDGGVNGGQLTDLTIGWNWYLTPYTRITSNYIHAWAQSPTGIHSGTDILGTRFQYDF